MKCKNCGVEFSDGIFCPECGTKSELAGAKNGLESKRTEKEGRLAKFKAEQGRIAKERAEHEERLAKLKAEQECLASEKAEQEKERLAKEKAEQERLAKEKVEHEKQLANAKIEQERLAKEKAELEARTFNGITYGSEEEAHIAIKENGRIDLLKQRMIATKSQKKRREIFAEFNSDIRTSVAKQRLNLLQERISRDQPKSITVNWIYGITIILSFVISTIFLTIENEALRILAITMVLWYFMGLPVWIVWKIVLFIKSKTKSFHLYIKDI